MLILAAALGAAGTILWFFYVGPALTGAAVLLIVLVLIRAFSKRFDRRQMELLGYEKLIEGIRGFFSRLFKKRDRSGESGEVVYKYFNCPECGQKMRAPKGKGRIRVTCTKCGTQFEKRV